MLLLLRRESELEGVLDSQNMEEAWRHTALTYAVCSNFPAGVKLLLEAGASVDKQIIDGCSPLTLAAFEGNEEIVAMLIQFGASVGLRRDNGSTALHCAAQEGKEGVIGVLLGHGADVDSAKLDGATPLYMAAQDGRTGAVALLLQHGADVDLALNAGATPLLTASEGGFVSIIELLLEHKANVHAANNQGINALHCAAFADRPEACLLLISHGLDPATTTDNDGWSALSHYGYILDDDEDGEDEEEDEDDPDTRPRLSPEAKAERRALLTTAREAFLQQQRRDANWKRRFPFLDALVSSKLRATAAVAAQQKLEQTAVDTSAALPAVPRGTKEQNRDYLQRAVFSDEGFVRKIAEYL